ncbi:MAG: glycosyltransferase [Ferruginibacter sp.]
MDPGISIPVQGYGGIERMVELLAKEYNKAGHEVHLFVTAGSFVAGCKMHSFGKVGFPPKKTDALSAIPVAWNFLWKHRHDFDLIHNFGRLAYLIPVFTHPVKKIMSYQREISKRNIQFINKLHAKNLVFTACSADLLSRLHVSGNWDTVHNAVDFSRYQLQETILQDAPLIFLGRLERVKGCHIAIRIAKESNHKLIIAGNISSLQEEKDYFENEIKPHVDGIHIQYVGQLNDEQKNEYLGKAKALLFPIEWNEPFGIVMLEAIACGTPVIGFKKGSVNEVIDEGITGFKVNTFNEMVEAVENIPLINRQQCRQKARLRFDSDVIGKKYLGIVESNRKKIVIITTGQPAANPRALKEYQALIEKGYGVKYLYTYSASWSYKIDEDKFRSGELNKKDFLQVGGNPYNKNVTYFISRATYKIAGLLVKIFPYPFLKKITMARSALSFWLVAKNYKADLYIAHYLGALPAAIRAGGKYNVPVVFDAEDFHRGEQKYYAAQSENIVAVENKLLPKVNVITTASPLISEAYKKLYPQKNVVTINNVFSLKHLQQANPGHNQKVRLLWFSQNVGINRGLEIFITALNYLPGYNIDLTIMGNNQSIEYKKKLYLMADDPQQIIFKEPISPDAIFTFASNYDIGLAGEIPNCVNKEICLSNKLFTYLLAGNCVLSSDTPAQRRFLENHPGIGLLYKYDDPRSLADQIKRCYDDRNFLTRCKKNSLLLSKQKMNWENEEEIFMDIIHSLV